MGKPRKRSATQTHAFKAIWGFACERCGKRPKNIKEIHAHHKVSHEDGGTDSWFNLMCLCRECHILEHVKMGRRKNKKL